MVIIGESQRNLFVMKYPIYSRRWSCNEDPCNWDIQLDLPLNKASSGLNILRVYKFYSYSRDELTILYNSLTMSLFSYAIEVFGGGGGGGGCI